MSLAALVHIHPFCPLVAPHPLDNGVEFRSLPKLGVNDFVFPGCRSVRPCAALGSTKVPIFALRVPFVSFPPSPFVVLVAPDSTKVSNIGRPSRWAVYRVFSELVCVLPHPSRGSHEALRCSECPGTTQGTWYR